MRTRKTPCPVEKVWVDKPKYDEAERLHYEREAMLAAAPEECLELEAVNGVLNDESLLEGEPKGDPKRGRNGKKQRKRKRSPKPKGAAAAAPKAADSVLSGLSAEHACFEKPSHERAESLSRKKAVDWQSQEVVETQQPAPKPSQELPHKARMLSAALPCAHGSLSACHHVVRGVWLNKADFEKAEKVFVERSQLFAPPNLLAIPSLVPGAENVGSRTPDEGYGTALPTPATPSLAPDLVSSADLVSSPPLATPLPDSLHPTVNGKPQASSLQALVSEVWLEKPLYDGAEKSFYENMFDGAPAERNDGPEASKKPREDGKNPGRGQKEGAERTEPAGSPPPSGAEHLQPPFFFLHQDSEAVWLSKPAYDRAEARYYAAEALKASKAGESPKTPQPPVLKPSQPAAKPPSAAAPEPKKMAVEFLAHERIWFEKFKYDEAERRYYEQMNGPAGGSSQQQQENGASTILRDIARARENIQKSLAGAEFWRLQLVGRDPTGGERSYRAPAPPLRGPVTKMSFCPEFLTWRQKIKTFTVVIVADLQMAIFKLESRLNALEKSTSHQPSPVPPTQKVEPFSVPSKKVELPSASPAKKAEPAAAEEDDDDDIDLFGSDDEEEDQEAAKVREERLRQYAEKKAKKPGLIAKSSILLDVKPWDDETDMAKMEECVRSVQMDGLVWGASKLVPVGYGIKKLQIQCVVEDDKVGTDILEEEITKFEDYVQSVDIAAFNKI
ncbi:Elongation factor 1-delta [Aix galericulata]|nr:Elongation factor 1-delta [Aix galericulata]